MQTTTTSPASTTVPAVRASRAYRQFVAGEIGPRRVGGIYHSTSQGDTYEVLEIEEGPRTSWPTWQITVRTVGTTEKRRHCTGWDADRDQVVLTPEQRASETRHLADEVEHPVQIAAFQHAAPGYAAALALDVVWP